MSVATTETTMTPRQRWLAAVRRQPVDRLPFWPKLDGAYAPAQAEPFRSMDNGAIHRFIGSEPHAWTGPCSRRVMSRCGHEQRRDGDARVEHFITPSRTLVRVERYDAGSASWHPVEFPVKQPGDIAALADWFDDCRVEPDDAALAEVRARCDALGEQAVTAYGVGTSPLMAWVQHLAGVENAHLFLADRPDEVAALFGAMQRVLLDSVALAVEHHPADLLYLVENTSTTLVSVEQYRRLCFDHIDACARVARAGDRLMVLHMCGLLGGLLGELSKLPVAAFEAFTCPPLGDTTLADGRDACPDTCLIGGTQATLWLEEAEVIIEHVRRSLEALPHDRGVVITSAGVMPPACPPEKIKAVCDWVHGWSARA